MNPTKQIGRYILPILSVVAIEQRAGLRAWWKKGYDVTLTNRHVIHFTEEEKRQYDQAIEKHSKVIQLNGMCRTLGWRG
jgi:hypothetical protein